MEIVRLCGLGRWCSPHLPGKAAPARPGAVCQDRRPPSRVVASRERCQGMAEERPGSWFGFGFCGFGQALGSGHGRQVHSPEPLCAPDLNADICRVSASWSYTALVSRERPAPPPRTRGAPTSRVRPTCPAPCSAALRSHRCRPAAPVGLVRRRVGGLPGRVGLGGAPRGAA